MQILIVVYCVELQYFSMYLLYVCLLTLLSDTEIPKYRIE